MLQVITQMCRSWTTGYRASAPASTFMVATVFTLVVAGATRLAFGAVPPPPVESIQAEIVVSPIASPGGRVAVAVESSATEAISVYLPGLSATTTTLSYDAATGYHLGHLAVPATAPRRGHFTVRVVFPDGVEADLRVALSSCASERGPPRCHPSHDDASLTGALEEV